LNMSPISSYKTCRNAMRHTVQYLSDHSLSTKCQAFIFILHANITIPYHVYCALMSSCARKDRQTTFLEQACRSDLQLDIHSNITVMQCEVPCAQKSLRIFFDMLGETYRESNCKLTGSATTCT